MIKNKKIILVDAIYINSGGGKVLLEYLIDYLSKKKIEVFYLFDSRLDLDISVKTENSILNPSESERKFFYKGINKQDFHSILCFGNIPPPIKLEANVYIYFHNELLLDPLKLNLGLHSKLKFLLKKIYLRYKNHDNYKWITQTDRVSKKLNHHMNIKIEKIKSYPFFNPDTNTNLDYKKDKTSFIYPANFSNHKNHYKLFKAFNKIHHKNKVKLYLTLNQEIFKNSFYSKNDNENIEFINLGEVPNKDLLKYFTLSKYLIFPSLNESFGLPLIEAVINDCFVICSEKDYIHEIIKPTLTFDPNSSKSIALSINNALNSNLLRKSTLVVENKIDSFVKYILRDV